MNKDLDNNLQYLTTVANKLDTVTQDSKKSSDVFGDELLSHNMGINVMNKDGNSESVAIKKQSSTLNLALIIGVSVGAAVLIISVIVTLIVLKKLRHRDQIVIE